MTAATFASNILEQAKLTNDQVCNHVTAACDPMMDWIFELLQVKKYIRSAFFTIFSYYKKQVVLISYEKIQGKKYFYFCQLI